MKHNLIASSLFAGAVILAASFGPLRFAATQAQGAGSPCSGTPCQIPNLFDPDLADLKSANNQALNDFIKGALDKIKGGNNDKDRGCYPLPITITVFTKPIPNDPALQDLISDARMEAIWNYFSEQGLDPQKNLEPIKALGPKDGTAEGTYNDVDRDPPVLKMTWEPPENSKVKQGTQIKIHATASERHADGHRSWPSGVKSLQLIVNGILDEPKSKDFGMKPPPCKVQPFDPIYTVPKNPPPIVHIRIYTEDATTHGTFEEADFPTGDWHGTLREHAQGNIYNDTVYVDFSFNEERDGTIKGTGRVDKMTSEPQLWTGCTSTRTLNLKPGEAEFPISGKHVGDEFQLDLPADRRLTMNIKTDCPPPRRSGTTEGRRSLGMSETFYHPKVNAKDGATNEFHKPGALKVDGWIEIHRAKQEPGIG
jgi:hypothetical protein